MSFFKEVMDENEALDSCKKNFKEKFSNCFWGWFILLSLIINWEFIYTAFFVSEDKIWDATCKLRNVYLKEQFLHFDEFWFYALHFILPFGLACFFVWIFPKFLVHSYRAQEENKTRYREVEIKELEKRQEIEERALLIKKEEVSTEKEKIKTEREIEEINPEIKWKKEYENFKKSNHFSQFEFIKEGIYKYGGWTDYGDWRLPQDIKAFCDVNGLITIFYEKDQEKIKFTDKGRYFMRMYESVN